MIHKKIKKAMVFLGLLVFAVFISFNTAEAANGNVGLSFKFGGGMGLLFNGGGDIEKARLGYQEYYSDLGSVTNYSTTFNWKKMSTAMNFEADLILTFGQNFGFGIGSGYIRATNDGDYSYAWSYTGYPWYGTDWEDEEDIYTMKYTMSAIPIRFTLYFFVPMNSMSFYGFGGLGYYMGKLNATQSNDYTDNWGWDSWYYWNEEFDYSYNSEATQKATCNALGFHGGIGLKMNLSQSVGIAFELFGRLVNFKNWEGDVSWSWNDRLRYWHELVGWYYDDTLSGSGSESGKMWYYEWHSSYFNKDYSEVTLSETKPTWYKNVREAAFNLNAFGVSVSIIFHFNLI
ncbi:MAG: hypothetical protein WCC06_05150 [Candidatus Aminicenantales bacterium]